MKVECSQKELERVLGTVARTAASRSAMPIIQNALIRTQGGRIEITATDLETTASATLDAVVEEDGTACVPAKLLADLVGSMSSATVRMEPAPQDGTGNAHGLIVTGGEAVCRINGVPPEEFPPVNTGDEEGQTVQIAAQEFARAAQRVAFSAAKAQDRPVLTGVELRFNEDGFKMAAADGFRLSVQDGKTQDGSDTDSKAVIPAKAISEAGRLAQGRDENAEITLSADGRRAIIRLDGSEPVSLAAQLIQGAFPEYDGLIPEQTSTNCTTNQDELNRAVRRAALFAGDSSNIIRMEFTPQEGEAAPRLNVSGTSRESGEAQEPLTLRSMSGPATQIAFNSQYLTEILQQVGSSNLQIGVDNPSNPAVFRIDGDDSYIHVIMPMQVEWGRI